MSIAHGKVHPPVYEVEVYAFFSLSDFYYHLTHRDIIPYINDYLETEAYDLHDRSDCDVDLIDFEWTLEKCEQTPRKVNGWNLAGNVKFKAFVAATTEAQAIRVLKNTIQDTFNPCSGDLTIHWDRWLEDVAEGAAA